MTIVISNDRSLIEFERLNNFIQNAYWAEGRTTETIKAAIDGSLCFVALEGDQQVGFARVITDGATLAYVCDVIVFEEFRGRGISRLLVESILDHPQLKSVEVVMLATRDAHGLYAKYGFQPVVDTSKYMRLIRDQSR